MISKVQQLLTACIDRGFPEIDSNVIVIRLVHKKDYFMTVEHKGRKIVLSVDRTILKRKDKIIVGVLAHELAHLLVPCGVKNEERKSDKLAVKRGFVKELYSFVKWHDRRYARYKKKDGLTRKELKKLRKTI